MNSDSESNDRSKREPQIIVRAIVEIDVVANFKSQSDWSDRRFHTRRRVDRRVPARCSQAEKSAHSIAQGQQARAQPKIHEAALQCNERPKSSSRWLKLRPE